MFYLKKMQKGKVPFPLFWLVLLSMLIVSGCGGGGEACTPNETKACSCLEESGLVDGVQICAADGIQYGDCVCSTGQTTSNRVEDETVSASSTIDDEPFVSNGEGLTSDETSLPMEGGGESSTSDQETGSTDGQVNAGMESDDPSMDGEESVDEENAEEEFPEEEVLEEEVLEEEVLEEEESADGSSPAEDDVQAEVVDEEGEDEEVVDEEPVEEEPVEEEPVEEEPVEEEPVDEDADFEDLEGKVGLEDLTAGDLAEIEILRTAIFSGIAAGNEQYLEVVSQELAALEITPTYGLIGLNGWDVLDEPVSFCPFIEYYENGFEPTGYACEYLVDEARSKAYSKLFAKLAGQALPAELATSDLVDEAEAQFWMEQGAISGIEEQRVLVQLDIKAKGLCNQNLTPGQGAQEKGLIKGRQLMVDSLNDWLASHGYTGEYPTLSAPIDVCNLDESILDPAEQDALNSISAFMVDNPLCEDFQPATAEDDLLYGQANTDYADALQQGVKDEFALAAVQIFNVIPCNVSDPLILDLDRDGIELLPVHKGVNFDIWSSGKLNAVAWTNGDDGFLVLDRNGNGVIDDGAELFGNINGDHADGFSQLSELDTAAMGGNEDGALTAEDAAFSQLLIWQDANVDGISEAGELMGLDAYRVTVMLLQGEAVDYGHAGSPIPTANHVETEEGPMLMADAFLRTAPYPSLSAYLNE